MSKKYLINIGYMHDSNGEGHSCGYCKNESGSVTYGFSANLLKPE